MKPLALALSALVALPAAATAQSGECWRRVYDNAHLAAHPEQMVVEIAFGPSSTLIGDAAGHVAYNLEVRLRGQDWPAFALAMCAPGKGMGCVLEGDAGQFTIEPDGRSILLRVGADGLWLEGPGGLFELSSIRGDDRLFRLDPTEPAGCPPV